VNQYGTRALAHWRQHLPGQLAQIPDQEEFFTRLGETAQEEIGHRAEALAQLQAPGEGYLQETGRLETARQMAESAVIREMVLVDPQDLEAVGQLLG